MYKNREYFHISEVLLLSIYLLIKLWSSCLIACLIEAVRTNPGYGMATLIYNYLFNSILGTVMLLRSNYIIQEEILCIYLSNL